MMPHGRPPWWPEGEPFPPAGPGWRHRRGRFMRRVALFALVAFLLFAFVVALFVTFLLGVFGATTSGAAGPLVPLGVLLVVLIVASSVARGIRRVVAPLGDLIDAAESVEAGNYSVRVRGRGPRELRALARAFNAMSARLEASESERRRLLADVTHELRTPLTVVQGDIEALIDGVHPADPEHLGSILDETRVLSRLIDDLRTLSLAGSGGLPLHREAMDVGALARDAVASFAPQADAGGVALHAEVEAGLPAVDADPVRIREVVSNLLSNALRHTPRGGTVTVAVGEAAGWVAVTVRDTGTGIAPEVLPHLFERFARSAGSPGAGLGLAIAKGIVTAHGGEIGATSAPGAGTQVRFTLPASA